MNDHNMSIDCRVKIPPKAKPLILERVEDGETPEEVASRTRFEKGGKAPLLPCCKTPEDAARALACFAKRIKADTETTNAIAIGTLLVKAKLGELMKANTRKESGAKKGKKKGASPSEAPFSSSTIATFRKLDKYDARLPEYRDKVDSHNAENPEYEAKIESGEMSDRIFQKPPATTSELACFSTGLWKIL